MNKILTGRGELKSDFKKKKKKMCSRQQSGADTWTEPVTDELTRQVREYNSRPSKS